MFDTRTFRAFLPPSYTQSSFIMGTLLIPSVASWPGHVVDPYWYSYHLSNLTAFEEDKALAEAKSRRRPYAHSQGAFSLCPFSQFLLAPIPFWGQLSNCNSFLHSAVRANSQSKCINMLHHFLVNFTTLMFFLWIPPCQEVCDSRWAILRFCLFLFLLSCSQCFKSTIWSLLNLKYIFLLLKWYLYFLTCLHVPLFFLRKDWLSWFLNFFSLYAISLFPPLK